MERQREAFFPAVLRDPRFQRDGILFGAEPGGRIGLHWVVIDPRRHVMQVWKKIGASYPATATALSASVFTNGPFCDYLDGTLTRSTVRAVLDFATKPRRRGCQTGSGKALTSLKTLVDHWQRCKVEHYQAAAPLGFVFGEANGVSETTVSRPYLHYFGRGRGSAFDDYQIAQGDPSGMSEVVGGLFRRVADYVPKVVRQQVGAGLWGLAPLTDDAVLQRAGIGQAVDAYLAGAPAEVHASMYPGGLVVAMVYWGNTAKMARLAASIRVKDAVQIDGNNSLLFGGGADVFVGRRMPERKRLLQVWGIQFRPIG